MRIIIRVLILVLLVGCKQNSQSQSNKVPLELIESVINTEVTRFLKPPYTTLSGVIYINGTSYQFHFGKLLNGNKPDNQTIYEIASITKTYTGLLLSQAIADNQLSLNADVRKYLKGHYPDLQLDANRPVTLKHLITHSAGLPPVINCVNVSSADSQVSCYSQFTRNDFFEKLKHVKLIDRSGTNYNYSNAGVQLLGYILEDIYQSPFQELVKEYIFSRSGERQTCFQKDYNEKENISLGKNSEGNPVPLINGFYNYAGGLKSSTSSMLNYLKMYLENEDPVIQQAMNRLAGTQQYGRAYAWNTYNYDKDQKMLYHNGGTFGHSTWIALYPNQKTGIFLVTNILTNNSQGLLNQLSNKIIEQLLK
jgi:D-alanyl-D-alanine-carboxypeptidase/D-alanyl-D-alanine-endopeptidase